MTELPLLQVRGISKSFPGVQALSDVSLDFFSGETHVLIGENGAGKTTLIKIIAGVYLRDSGTISFKGREVNFTNPRQALDQGISVIHQELSLIPDLSVAENILLGREPLVPRTPFLNKKTMLRDSSGVLQAFDLDIDPRNPVRKLSQGQKQMVELARAVSRNSRLVIMDEPTSSLSEKEVSALFRMIERLEKQQIGIIYVSHRLHEIREIGDRVSVLRDGKYIKTLPAKNADETELVVLMVGREIKRFFPKREKRTGEPVLEVTNLTRASRYRNVNFTLHRGEILGIAGLIGAGRTDLLRGIYGAHRPDSGSIRLFGKASHFRFPKDAIKNKIGLVPEERRSQGLLLFKSIKENIALPSLYKRSKNGFVDRKWERATAVDYVKRLGIRTPSENTQVANLSGGNQQKVVIAKWLTADSSVLLLDEPTRGIDVNAKAEIYGLMEQFTEVGGSIIIVSSDLPEILGVADRIIVMREGIVTGILEREEATEERVMTLASVR